MATTTNFGWETPDDTDLVKDGAAAIRTALNGVDTSFAELKGGTTGQVLSKASGTDLDFTWVAQDDSNAIQNAIVDAKGDLIAATAADTPARLAVGTNGQVLTADSGEATGLKWTTPSTGGGLTLITETSASALSSLSFSSISSSYKQLLLVWTGVHHSATGSQFGIRFNNDSGTNYHISGFQASGTTYTTGGTDLTHLGGLGADIIYAFGESCTFNGKAQDPMGMLLIDNYASTSKTKNVKWNVSYYDNTNGRYNAVNTTSFYNSTSAISSIDIVRLSGSATFTNANNTSIRLYGVS